MNNSWIVKHYGLKIIFMSILMTVISANLVVADVNKAYVANEDENSLSVIDLDKLEVIKTIPVSARPFKLALSPNQPILVVGYKDSPIISLVDTSSDQVIDNIVVLSERHIVEAFAFCDTFKLVVALDQRYPSMIDKGADIYSDGGFLYMLDIDSPSRIKQLVGFGYLPRLVNEISVNVDQDLICISGDWKDYHPGERPIPHPGLLFDLEKMSLSHWPKKQFDNPASCSSFSVDGKVLYSVWRNYLASFESDSKKLTTHKKLAKGVFIQQIVALPNTWICLLGSQDALTAAGLKKVEYTIKFVHTTADLENDLRLPSIASKLCLSSSKNLILATHMTKNMISIVDVASQTIIDSVKTGQRPVDIVAY